MNKLITTTISSAATVVALSAGVAYGVQGDNREGGSSRPGCHLSQEEVSNWGETSARLPQACDQDPYTVLDHPALPCQLSRADVANWGETSAHLPQACSYRPEK